VGKGTASGGIFLAVSLSLFGTTMSFMDFCVTGLASFMIGVQTLAGMVFFVDWLRRDESSKVDPRDDPALATAICELPDVWAALCRRETNDLAGAIKVTRPGRPTF